MENSRPIRKRLNWVKMNADAQSVPFRSKIGRITSQFQSAMDEFKMSIHTLDPLNRLVDKIYDDVHKDWIMSGRPKDHHYEDLLVVSGWVDDQFEKLGDI
jgi:hypothetical protein